MAKQNADQNAIEKKSTFLMGAIESFFSQKMGEKELHTFDFKEVELKFQINNSEKGLGVIGILKIDGKEIKEEATLKL